MSEFLDIRFQIAQLLPASIFLLRFSAPAHPPKEKYSVNKKTRVHLLENLWPLTWCHDPKTGMCAGLNSSLPRPGLGCAASKYRCLPRPHRRGF